MGIACSHEPATVHSWHQHGILLIDDEPDLRESLETVLEVEGYGVVLAEDGDEALAHLRRGLEPCLILLDLMMPQPLSGSELRATRTPRHLR